MDSASPDRHLVENEVIFRQRNQKISKDLETLAKEAKKEGMALHDHSDLPLHFYCECSDETCTKRIVLKPSTYEKLHKNSSQFLIRPGHQVVSIERLVKAEPKYLVVEKYLTPPKKVAKLHATDFNAPQ